MSSSIIKSRTAITRLQLSASPVSLMSFRSLHSSPYRGKNDEVNNKAINVYQDLLSIYSDQSMTSPLKQQIVKGVFLNNDIRDISSPIFKRLNSIIRQDPNLVDEEKLNLITTLNTNYRLFQDDLYNINDQELSIRDVMDNDNFLKKAVTATSVIALSLFSIITLAALV